MMIRIRKHKKHKKRRFFQPASMLLLVFSHFFCNNSYATVTQISGNVNAPILGFSVSGGDLLEILPGGNLDQPIPGQRTVNVFWQSAVGQIATILVDQGGTIQGTASFVTGVIHGQVAIANANGILNLINRGTIKNNTANPVFFFDYLNANNNQIPVNIFNLGGTLQGGSVNFATRNDLQNSPSYLQLGDSTTSGGVVIGQIQGKDPFPGSPINSVVSVRNNFNLTDGMINVGIISVANAAGTNFTISSAITAFNNFTTLAGSTTNLTATGTITGAAGAIFTNNGNFTAQTGSTFNGITTFSNGGVFNLATVFAIPGNQFTNTGVFTVNNGGSLNSIGTTLTNSGTMNLNAGGTITAATLINNNNFNYNGGTLTINNLNNVGLFNLNTAFNFNGAGFTNTGTFNINTGGALNGGASTYNNQGTFNIFNGGIFTAGVYNNFATTNAMSGSTLIITTLNNAANANFQLASNLAINGGNFTNNGTFNILNGGTLTALAASTLVNAGTMNLNSGGTLNATTLTNTGTFNSLGSINTTTLNNNGTFNLIAGTLNATTINNNNLFNFNGGNPNFSTLNNNGTFNLNTPFTPANQIINNNGVFNNNSNIIVSTSKSILGPGTYVQNGTLTTNILNALPGGFGQLNISGIASVGGTIAVNPLNNGSQINNGDTFDVLTAGSLVDNNPAITQPPSFLFFERDRSAPPNVIRLRAVRFTQNRFVITEPSIAGLAQALNSMTPGNTRGELRNAIIALQGVRDLNTFINDLTQLIPDVSGSTIMPSLVINDLLLDKIATRIDRARLRRLAGYTAGDVLGESGYAAGDMSDSHATYGPYFFGNYLHQDRIGIVDGYNAITGGLGVLYDYPVNSCGSKLGASLSYAQSGVRSLNTGNQNFIYNVTGSLYGVFEYNWLYIDGLVSVGLNNYRTKRNIPFLTEQATAKFNGIQKNAMLKAGLNIPIGPRVQITPLARYQYTWLNIDQYTETGIAPTLTVVGQQIQTANAAYGFKLMDIGDPDAFLPEIHVMFINYTKNPNLVVTSEFTGGGPAFVAIGPQPAKTGTNVGGGITARLRRNFLITGRYDYEYRKNLQSHSAILILRYLIY